MDPNDDIEVGCLACLGTLAVASPTKKPRRRWVRCRSCARTGFIGFDAVPWLRGWHVLLGSPSRWEPLGRVLASAAPPAGLDGPFSDNAAECPVCVGQRARVAMTSRGGVFLTHAGCLSRWFWGADAWPLIHRWQAVLQDAAFRRSLITALIDAREQLVMLERSGLAPTGGGGWADGRRDDDGGQQRGGW